ncbi:MAG: hypothetical protein ABFR82_00875 [Nitrospirota bacterium]
MRSVHIVLLAIILIFFALNNNSLYAKEKGALGAGIILGKPIGPNVKYWFNSNAAVDFGLGFDKDFVVYSDFLWHDWTIFPQPSKGALAGYLGLGIRYEEESEDDEFGFRAVAGVDYWLASHPIEFFLEIAPVFQVTPDTDTDFDAGVGLRYYFMGL